MNKSAIQKFAVWARSELIDQVKQKAHQYKYNDKSNLYEIDGVFLSEEEQKQRKMLIEEIEQKGFEQVMEEAAYAWFNRFIALRFLEVNNYLPNHIRIISNQNNEFKPEILESPIDCDLPELDQNKVINFINKSQIKDLYKYLLLLQCRALSKPLPYMFKGQQNDYTELLFPNNILSQDGILGKLISIIPEDDWKEHVQIIGWLYQYYNTELKDLTFKDLKQNIKIKKENIPAATQIFTPHWIVCYMVENSLGRIFINSKIRQLNLQDEQERISKEKELAESLGWKYYLPEAEQTPEVRKQLNENSKSDFSPEEVKIIDPCMGSGHILVYAFDVLIQIYKNLGYDEDEAVPLILEKNLYGLDIDDRATQLAYFAVMMKARKYDRMLFVKKNTFNINLYSLSQSTYNDVANQIVFDTEKELGISKEWFEQAKEVGSLIDISKIDLNSFDEKVAICNTSGQASGIEEQIKYLQKIIHVLSDKYDVVITNPPYMGGSGMNTALYDYVKHNYPNEKYDLFSCFINKGNNLTKTNGYNAMVTMQSWMFLPRFAEMRKKILNNYTICCLLHMDSMVLGIAFGTSATIFSNTNIKNYKSTYNHVKLCNIKNDKPTEFPVKGNRFTQITNNRFFYIPDNPIAYWISEKIAISYTKNLIRDTFKATVGIQTGNNNLFLKYWHEVEFQNINFKRKIDDNYAIKWYPHPKGGGFRKWYGNFDYIINWQYGGKDLEEFKGCKTSIQKFNCDGVCWSHTTSGAFSSRIYNRTSIPNLENPVLFCEKEKQYEIIAFLNTKVTNYLLNMLNSTMHYHVGDILNLPLIECNNQDKIKELSIQNITLSRTDWDSFETSWDFKRHPMLPQTLGKNSLIKDCFEKWQSECEQRFNQLKTNEEELNRIFIEIYGLQDELTPEVAEKDVTVRKADLQRDIKSLISYAVGCILGRYSLNKDGLAYAGGKWQPESYAYFQPVEDNVLQITDDDYIENDITHRFINWLESVYGKDTLNSNLAFIANALEGKGNPKDVIRNYFINGFYADHLKIYQKRPIYWLFDSGKTNGFKALIYVHRYTTDQLAILRTEYIFEQQERYRTKIKSLDIEINESGPNKAKLNKLRKKLQEQSDELHAYEEYIKHYADSKITIDLDDGVKLNYAKFEDVLAKIR